LRLRESRHRSSGPPATELVFRVKRRRRQVVRRATLAQYKLSKGSAPLCIDTDPINSTFHGYKGLSVQRIELLDGDEINTRHFDALVELVASSTVDVIIDNGASSFVPLSHYLTSKQVPALRADIGISWWYTRWSRAARRCSTPSAASRSWWLNFLQKRCSWSGSRRRDGGASVRRQIDDAMTQGYGRIQNSTRVGWLNVTASCITMLAAVLVAWAAVNGR
jgi:hypothetical protein